MGPAQWLAMARDDLRAAEILAEQGIAQLSCFHSEQAVEKAMMALRLYQQHLLAAGDGAAVATLSADEAPHAQGAALEAVQTAQQIVHRVTERLYGGE